MRKRGKRQQFMVENIRRNCYLRKEWFQVYQVEGYCLGDATSSSVDRVLDSLVDRGDMQGDKKSMWTHVSLYKLTAQGLKD